jgi:hypothetical protein
MLTEFHLPLMLLLYLPFFTVAAALVCWFFPNWIDRISGERYVGRP